MSLCLNLSDVKNGIIDFHSCTLLFDVFSIDRMSKLMLHCRKYIDLVVLFNWKIHVAVARVRKYYSTKISHKNAS